MAERVLELSGESLIYLRFLAEKLGPDLLYSKIFAFFQEQGLVAAGFISRNFARKYLKVRSGRLAGSFLGQAENFTGLPGIRVGILRGPALRYAGVQELGTQSQNPNSPYPDIIPRKGKGLSMPVGQGLTPPNSPRGLDRYGGPEKAAQVLGELKFIPFRNSGVAIGKFYSPKEAEQMKRERKRTGKVDLVKYKGLYLLLRKVGIKPKYFLRDGFEAYLPQLLKGLAELLKNLFLGFDNRGVPLV